MDIMGHLAVIEHAGVSDSRVWSSDALVALFPNLAHCHEWAYKRLREDIHQEVNPTEKLIQGHIITDWVIHHGNTLTPQRHRIGWAYDEAPRIGAQLDSFIDNALSMGLAENDPRLSDTREHLERDFGHTAAECALDLRIGMEVADTPRYDDLKRELAKLADPAYAKTLVADVFDRTGGYTREGEELLSRTMSEYGAWADEVRHPEDFAALTLCTKFDWPYERATVDYVLTFLHDVGKGLDPGAADRLVADVVAAIADPGRMAPAK
ncbi:hypothetical protein [Micromonospora sp. NPDC023644]|uniref:hypothetical protein n=1 Tax=Micromonospora sp. NPDC023644 TaxID=3154321 RepID=UPI00340A3F64